MMPLPLLLPLFKNGNFSKLFSLAEGKGNSFSAESKTPVSILPSVSSPKLSVPVSGELTKQESLLLIRESIFQSSKMTEWRNITEKEDPTVKEWKPVWNFLFPGVAWTKNRSYWKDERKKRGWECFYRLEENTPKYFCIVFESLRTGKIWFFFSFPYEDETFFRLDIQTEKESSYELLQNNFFHISPLLTNVKEVEFHLADLANSLLSEESSLLGVYA
ncbi:hypothetical protein [Leptospira idonii]|uniref:Uncharacterized protein n=1 Tax=Leptospira idonii TaxID=1193500 RepID=A0A4R9LXW5_9LEPT|nr:hypothetical protein [Leptospira idonii]TGN18532.1 hypothetical protein EHS15_14185 [Leptospira idonii]